MTDIDFDVNIATTQGACHCPVNYKRLVVQMCVQTSTVAATILPMWSIPTAVVFPIRQRGRL
jgi:hypothetical protein